ncbi:MAG: C-type lectin domain-containing protein [Owenweeksia sp.]|nr:C-type lectin domain-containing protein [Owenweeksia sp.]
MTFSLPTATDNCASGPAHPTSLPGYTYMGLHGGHSYFLSNDSVAGDVAAALAVAAGGHLVTISNSTENSLVSSFTTKEFWIGLADTAVEGSFEWINGEPLSYTNWASGEPNDFKKPRGLGHPKL